MAVAVVVAMVRHSYSFFSWLKEIRIETRAPTQSKSLLPS
jgi:hypothetical protein